MRLDGRRTSSNVSDRRGSTGRKLGIGGGIVGVIIVAVLTLLNGGNIGDVVSNIVQQGGFETAGSQPRELDAEDRGGAHTNAPRW